MAINDVTVSSVFGDSAVICAGNAIPSNITSSSDKVFILVLSEAHAKASSATIKTINPTYTEANFNTATDIAALITSNLIAYTTLNAKPTNLRKFNAEVIGKSLDEFFETDVTNVARQYTITFYETTSLIPDWFDPSFTVLS